MERQFAIQLHYITFAMQLKIGRDPIYQASLFSTVSNYHIYTCCNTSFFDIYTTMISIKMYQM